MWVSGPSQPSSCRVMLECGLGSTVGVCSGPGTPGDGQPRPSAGCRWQGRMGWKRGHPTIAPTARPCAHLSPSQHPPTITSGRKKIPPLLGSAQINGIWGQEPQGARLRRGQQGTHSDPHLLAQKLPGKGSERRGSESRQEAGQSLLHSGALSALPALPKHIPEIFGIFYLQQPQLPAQLTSTLFKYISYRAL